MILSSDAQDHGVEESIFQNPAKLHLTIGTLVLLNDTEVRKASEHLQECQNTIRSVSKQHIMSECQYFSNETRAKVRFMET